MITMANPAELLHSIFIKWNNRGKTAVAARDDGELLEHRHAVRYLEEINELLDIAERAGKRVATYRKFFPIWLKTVFMYSSSWTGTNSGGIQQSQIDQLDNLINLLDEFVITPEEEATADLQDYLREVLSALDEDTSLSIPVRESARSVTNHMLGCIDDLTVAGEYDFKKSLERLLGALATVVLQTKKKDMWHGLLNKFVYPYAVGNLPQIGNPMPIFEVVAGAGS